MLVCAVENINKTDSLQGMMCHNYLARGEGIEQSSVIRDKKGWDRTERTANANSLGLQ